MVLVFEHEGGIFCNLFLTTEKRYMCGMCTVNKYYCVLLALNINPNTTMREIIKSIK